MATLLEIVSCSLLGNTIPLDVSPPQPKPPTDLKCVASLIAPSRAATVCRPSASSRQAVVLSPFIRIAMSFRLRSYKGMMCWERGSLDDTFGVRSFSIPHTPT